MQVHGCRCVCAGACVCLCRYGVKGLLDEVFVQVCGRVCVGVGVSVRADM